MFFPCTRLVIAFVGVMAVFPEYAYPQSQRLGIPEGNFTIKPYDRVARRGYCMDAGVAAPKAGALMSNLLTNM